ncbi:MAG: cytochrome P450 [Richelia sp. RM2_1_2]|nr:cytochrome P450 [Richelia sp. RM1_1_1]NJO60377.1 cytochrome P450 [Richelia sp. RM2_1_2]
MIITQVPSKLQFPPDLTSKEFANNKYEYYKWMREEAPVFRGKFIAGESYILTRYEDCAALLKDPRIGRDNRRIAGSKPPFPSFIPLPKSAELMMHSMIGTDEPDHKRLRSLVHQAFTRKSMSELSARIEQLTNELLDKAEAKSKAQGSVDLKEAYALPIPVTVIQKMVGVSDEDMPRFYEGVQAIIKGFSGWRIVRTMLWDMPRLSKFVRELIDRKRDNPSNDMLTGLIQAEEEGVTLDEDEIVSMVFLIITAGFETTVHLITNGVLTLLQHPQQLEKLRANPDLIESAVEEILRFYSPVHTTEIAYAREDIVLHGVSIPKGASVFFFIGAANHDPTVFENPEVFDIERFPNKHLGFGTGIHSCLGAPLARMETKIALSNLIARNPNLRLAVDPSELELQAIQGFHSYKSLPVVLG